MTIIVGRTQLDDLCAHIDLAGRFALDLEFIPERTYDPQLCLVQVATDTGAYIIDPLALPDLNSLWQRVANPKILVVLHAAEQDLELVYTFSGLLPQKIIDTQIAAGFAGYGYPVGYSKLLSRLLGLNISKTESYTDWTNRPLTSSQIDYALDDVRHLLPVYDALQERLDKFERIAWVEEECKRYSCTSQYRQDRSQEFLRIKGASSLSRRGLAVLRSLWEWRDHEACTMNRPPRLVIADNILLELSRRPPQALGDIQRIRGVRPDQIRSFGDKMMRSIERGLSLPDEACPIWPTGRNPPRRDVLIVDVLFAALKIICYKLEIAPELVATRNDLEALVRSYREETANNLALLQSWRYELAGKMLLELLEGAVLSLQVTPGDPPVTLDVERPTETLS